MKKFIRLPTILALILLVTGFTTGLFLVEKGPQYFSQASPEFIPNQIKITNLSDSGFTVSWITDSPTSGFVTYDKNSSVNQSTLDDRDQLSGQTGSFKNHYVTLKNLQSQTTYFYRLISGGQTYNQTAPPFEITTASRVASSFPPSDVATGTVLQNDNTPAEGAIVYLSLAGVTPQSALVRSSGDWLIPLNSAFSADLKNYSAYDRENGREEIFVQGNSPLNSLATTLTKDDNPIPEIVLGKTYDFTQATTENNLTPTPTPVSKFSLEGNYSPQANQNGEPTITNPFQNETVNTQNPEFFGTGKPGETVKITIHSSSNLSGSTKVNNQGEWSWTPPANLPPGNHTIEITIGNTTITRNFVVYAAENDFPAYTATPSGTLSPTPSTRASPTPTPSTTLEASPTPTPIIPASGNSPTTTLFFGFGLLLIFTSFFCYAVNNRYGR